jgi:hypothetical protein
MSSADDVIKEYRKQFSKLRGITPQRPHTAVPEDQHTASVFVLVP